MNYFEGKTIWITGASAGIGRALAIALSKMGAHLILSSRKESTLKETVALCNQEVNLKVLPLDLEDHPALEQIIKVNKALIDKVDILFNNGGLSQRSRVENTSFEVYKKLMDVNYLGTVKLSQAVLTNFIEKNEGHFVTISSMAGKFGVPVRSGYSAAKMALHGFFDAMRAELAKTNIKVTMICPGYIKTDISKNALTAEGTPQGTMDEAQLNGMDVNVMVNKVLKAVASGKSEYHVGGFREVKLAGLVSRLFPGFMRKILANSKTT